MSSRTAWVGVFVLAITGCDGGRTSPPRERPSVRTTGPSTTAPDETPRATDSTNVEAPLELGDTRDLDGLRVAREPSGRITVRGTDRWSRAIDVTYENDEYFRNAVPTLSLSVTEAQAAKLRTVAQHIPRAAAPAPQPSAPPSGGSGAPEPEHAETPAPR